MASVLDSFVAGAYFSFYTVPVAAVDAYNSPVYNQNTSPAVTVATANAQGIPSWLGASERGFSLRTSLKAEQVEGDLWGGSVVDIIYRGADVMLQFTSIAFRPSVVSAVWPWSVLGSMGTIGRLGSVIGGSLVMTAAPLTPAAGNPVIGQVVINSLTAANAIFEGTSELIFDSRLRKVPINLRLLPFYDRTIVYSPSQLGANSTNAIAGIGAGGLGIVAQVVPPAVVGQPQYTVISQAAYKWYSLL